jgi:phage protein D/phage baseplate assembly protein gpV
MVTFDAHAANATVRIGGPLPPPLENNRRRVVVELQRNLPAMCEVEFFDEDPSLPVLDNAALIRPGMPLTVELSSTSDDPTARSIGPVFDGEVVAIEARFGREGGGSVVLRGYDKSHRLHRTRKTRTFTQPDAMVVTQIAQDYGLIPRVDPIPPNPDPALVEQFYLCQRNQTDWEFLCERARELGCEISVSMGALVFRKAGKDPAAGVVTLTHGENLQTLRFRSTSAEQPMLTKVYSYNPALKTDVFGVAPPPVPENVPADATLLPHTVAASFGSTEDVETDNPEGLHPAAIMHAGARRDHTAGVAFEAEGICEVNPALKPGGTVLIQGVGLRFSGSYTVSSVRHVYSDRLETHFTISGRHDRTLLGLAQPGVASRANGNGSHGGRLLGPVTGIVESNTDPLQLGRVKVKLPGLGPDAMSSWAPVVSAGAGSGKGWQVIPEVDDQVLVVFEHGDVTRPFVLGGVYSAQDLQPQPVGAVLGDGKTQIRTFKTREGHYLEFSDTPGMESITLEMKHGPRLVLHQTPTQKVELTDLMGQNSITIDGATGSIAIKAMTSLTLEAQGNLELKATGAVKIESGAVMDVKSSGIMNVQGSMVKIN